MKNQLAANRPPIAPVRVLLAGCLAIASVALVTYAPALGTGFRLVDDYTNLQRAGSLPPLQYLVEALDPRLQNVSYRPLGLILLLIEYDVFHSEPTGYHLVQTLIHVANTLVAFGIVWHLAKRWRVALLAALFYAGLPVASEAVFWVSEQSPLAAFFSLVAVLFWLRYLLDKSRLDHLVAIDALIFALLSRESAVVLPAVFFLIDRMLVRDSISLSRLLRRYSPVILVVIVYLSIEYSIQSHGLNIEVGGYSLGEHVIANYIAYFSMLFDPWRQDSPTIVGSIVAISFLAFLSIAFIRRSAAALFLALMVFLSIGPVVFVRIGVTPRYLYLTMMPWAAIWAIILEALFEHWESTWLKVVGSVFFASLMMLNGSTMTVAATSFAETARQNRVPFRDIQRQHPTFPNNTRLFMIEPPYNTSIKEVAGMFFLRYGTAVSVGGTYQDGRPYTYGKLKSEKADLTDFAKAYVYYFDETNRPIEVAVDREAPTRLVPELPINFGSQIRLEGYEVTSSVLKRDQPLVLILYWRATGRIDRDYTVFVHLIDPNGQIVAGDDSMPRGGKESTSYWKPDQFTADAHVISLPKEAVAGSRYRLEVGLYYLPTLERLSIVDGRGSPITDQVVIESFEVVE